MERDPHRTTQSDLYLLCLDWAPIYIWHELASIHKLFNSLCSLSPGLPLVVLHICPYFEISWLPTRFLARSLVFSIASMECKKQALTYHFCWKCQEYGYIIPQRCQNSLLRIFNVKRSRDSLPSSPHLMWDMEAHTHQKKECGAHFSASSSSKQLEILGKKPKEFSSFACHWKRMDGWTDGLQRPFISHIRKGQWKLLLLMAVKEHRHSILHSPWMHKAHNRSSISPYSFWVFRGCNTSWL